jgi:hypothetical protein
LTHAGTTNSPTSNITGNIGTDGVATSIGVPCPEVTGTIYTIAAGGPSCSIINATLLDTAMLDEQTAYISAKGQPTTVLNTGNGAGEIGGQVLASGVYKFNGASSSVTISTDLTLNGNASDIWVFQIPQTFKLGATATPARVSLTGGALAKNIFWIVDGETTIYPSSTLEGNILDYAGIAMQDHAVLYGRAFSHTSSVTLIANTVTLPLESTTPVITSVLTTIILSSNLTNLTIGDNLHLNMTCLDQFDNFINATISYVTNDSSVATVNATSGLVSAIATGIVTITASNGTVSNSVYISVTAAPLTSDTTPPTILITGNNPETIFVNSSYNDKGATASDNIDGNLTGSIIVENNINLSIAGTYNITYSVTDVAGNSVQAVRIVNVEDITQSVPVQTSGSSGSGSSSLHSGSSSCATQWNCAPWNTCLSGIQTRSCTFPVNWCTPTVEKPIEVQNCTMISGTEADLATPQTQTDSALNETVTGTNGITGAITGAATGNSTWVDSIVNFFSSIFNRLFH